MKDMMNKELYSEKYDVFLSYRRDGGEVMAILLHERLSAKGYRTFLDIESLNSGSFNEKLLSVIEGCANFIVVCSKNCLDRCVNENDWVRKEIAHALKHNKNIVPVMLRGFEWPESLPEDIDALRMQNGISAGSNEYFDAAIDRLADKFLVKTAEESKSPPGWLHKTMAVLVSLFILAILLVSVGMFLYGHNQHTKARAPRNIMPFCPDNAAVEPAPIPAPEPVVEPVLEPAPIPAPKPTVITIKGVEYSTELYELDLSNKDLTNMDIVPIRHMRNIEVLNLSGNQISDLSPLSGLKGLKKLSLQDNKRITDLTPLKNLTNLTMLSLYFNPITDLTALSNMTKLEVLSLREHQINDITPLKNLVNLVDLSLEECQLSDIAPLSGLKKMRELNLISNQIIDITPLSGLANLKKLYVRKNQISNVTPLSGLTNLEILNLGNNQITDITPLSGLTNLKTLTLNDNPINDWSPVQHVITVYGRPRP